MLLVLHPRKQGWHDLAVKAVVIKERMLAPPRQRALALQAQQRAMAYEPERQPAMGYEPVPASAPSPVSYGPQRPPTRRCPGRHRLRRRFRRR